MGLIRVSKPNRSATAPTQPTLHTSASPTPTANQISTSGDYVPNDGLTFLEIYKSAGTSYTVTVESVATVDGLAVADLEIAIPDDEATIAIGEWPPEIYNIKSGANAGRVKVTFSDVTDMTVKAYSLAD